MKTTEIVGELDDCDSIGRRTCADAGPIRPAGQAQDTGSHGSVGACNIGRIQTGLNARKGHDWLSFERNRTCARGCRDRRGGHAIMFAPMITTALTAYLIACLVLPFIDVLHREPVVHDEVRGIPSA